MIEIKGSKGLIKLSPAEGKIGWELYSALLKECLKQDIKLGKIFDEVFKIIKSGDIKDIKSLTGLDIPQTLIDEALKAFMIIASSDDIREILIRCLKRSLYANITITEEVLDNHPEDYNLIFFYVLKEYTLPFFFGIKGLISSIFGK